MFSNRKPLPVDKDLSQHSQLPFSIDFNFLNNFSYGNDFAKTQSCVSPTQSTDPLHSSTDISVITRPVTAPPGFHDQPKSVYIGNLDSRVTEACLGNIFSEAGPIVLAKIVNDKSVI